MHKTLITTCLIGSTLLCSACKDEDKAPSPDGASVESITQNQKANQQEEITRESTGYAPTQQEAITEAIYNAYQQVYGKMLNKASFTQYAQSETSESLTRITIRPDISDKIISYDILSEDKDDDGWQVELRVKLRAPYKDAFAERIALVFPSREKLIETLKSDGFPTEAGEALSQKATKIILAPFRQCEEFVMLDRQGSLASSERELLDSNQTADREQIKQNQIKVADFVFSIRSEGSRFKVAKQTYPTTGQEVYRATWNMQLHIGLIDVASNAELTSVRLELEGKNNAFYEHGCIQSCVEYIEDEMESKLQVASAQLLFQLGFPKIQELKQLEPSTDFCYQAQIKGPFLLKDGQKAKLYSAKKSASFEAIPIQIQAVDVQGRCVTFKAERAIKNTATDYIISVAPSDI